MQGSEKMTEERKINWPFDFYQSSMLGLIGWIAITVTGLLQGQAANIQWQKDMERRQMVTESDIASLQRYHRYPTSPVPKDGVKRPTGALKPDQRLFRVKNES